MIRVIQKSTGAVCSTVAALADAMAIVANAPDELEIHAGDALAAARAEAAALVVAEADRYGALLTAGYPKSEQESWTAKAAEARDIAGGAAPSSDLHPVIVAESMFSGNSPTAIAAAALAKAGKFAKAAGAISGIRQSALARIEVAADEAGVNGALAWAKATAQAAFEALGA